MICFLVGTRKPHLLHSSGAHARHASEECVSREGVSGCVHTRLACAVASGDAAWGPALATS